MDLNKYIQLKMVYRRRSRYRRRRPRYRKSVKSVAYRALKVARQAKKMPELKYAPISGSATGTAYNGGHITELSAMSAGTSNNTRVGNQIHPTSIRIRPDWSSSTGFGDTTANVRLIIFRWVSEAPSTGFGNATEILQSASLNSFKSEAKRYQSEILYDKTWYQDNADVQMHPPEIKIKLRKPIAYDDAGASTSNRNGIYSLILNDSATTTYNYTFESRLFFRDP